MASIADQRTDPVGEEVRSVDRAAALLIALGVVEREAGVSELARSLGLHKSTASRLLATMQVRGLVERTDAGKYRLGVAVIRLGGQAERSLDLRSIAMHELEALARDVRETATLHTPSGDALVELASGYPPGAGRDYAGRTSPLHATAPGKIILASQPEREVMRLSRYMLTPYTPQTIVRVDALLEELARVRRRGFSTAFGEHEPRVNSVAVPVLDHRAAVVAALEIRGPSSRITPSRVSELVERARAAAAAITGQIGGVQVSA
jgi:DNA-binding IclR family transcriptional regulator